MALPSGNFATCAFVTVVATSGVQEAAPRPEENAAQFARVSLWGVPPAFSPRGLQRCFYLKLCLCSAVGVVSKPLL